MLGKLAVPLPVMGSHPGTAGKPSVPQAGFVPFVISWNALSNAEEYNCIAKSDELCVPHPGAFKEHVPQG